MIEIIVGIWLGSFLISILICFGNITLIKRTLNSPKVKTLNNNLKRLGKYWSHSESRIIELTENIEAEDHSKILSQSWWLCAFSLLSIIGLAIVFIAVISIHFLARSRQEQLVFGSPLALEDDLSKETTLELIQKLSTE